MFLAWYGLWRTASEINYYVKKHLVLKKNLKFDGYQREFFSMVFNFFDEKTSGGAAKNQIMSNEKLRIIQTNH